MYLSAWDEEHFCIMLENLAEMTLGKEKNTNEMQNRGAILAQEQTDSQYYVYPVSYTHLDVYKRQPLYQSEPVAC